MEIIKELIEYVLNFEIPFGDVVYKPVYLVYVSFAMSLLAYLLSKQRSD